MKHVYLVFKVNDCTYNDGYYESLEAVFEYRDDAEAFAKNHPLTEKEHGVIRYWTIREKEVL